MAIYEYMIQSGQQLTFYQLKFMHKPDPVYFEEQDFWKETRRWNLDLAWTDRVIVAKWKVKGKVKINFI